MVDQRRDCFLLTLTSASLSLMSDFDSFLPPLPGGSDFQDVRTIFERGTEGNDIDPTQASRSPLTAFILPQKWLLEASYL